LTIAANVDGTIFGEIPVSQCPKRGYICKINEHGSSRKKKPRFKEYSNILYVKVCSDTIIIIVRSNSDNSLILARSTEKRY
jgi:hypothetical protein